MGANITPRGKSSPLGHFTPMGKLIMLKTGLRTPRPIPANLHKALHSFHTCMYLVLGITD
jgi:hypothetical protein